MDKHSILEDLASMKSQPAYIMAMGVGGAGGNAVEHMWEMQIEGVNLAACNTDVVDLDKLHIRPENKILIGDGLGAGCVADKGAADAVASLDKVRDLLLARETKMLFLVAGMGAGTGTGATPVIAELAREMEILTVAIVTTPPVNEGPLKTAQANEGIAKLRKFVDAIIVLSNDAITQLYGHMPAASAFDRANDVVAFAAKGIAEIVTHRTNLVHVDFADVSKVIRNSGSAVMGVASETGEDRADKVVDKILASPLFGNVSISGARDVLVNISVSSIDGISLNEAHRVRDRVQHHAKSSDENGNTKLTNIIWGMSLKPNLPEDEVEVVIVATGFPDDNFMPKIDIKQEPESGEEPATEKDGEASGTSVTEVDPSSIVLPVRPGPTPITRPVRDLAELEECKRVPAYIKHKVTLSTASKTHSVAGVESEQPTQSSDQPALF